MGDLRYDPYFDEVRNASNPAAVIRSLTDEGVISALAAASRARDPYLANVLATEAHNRVDRSRAVVHNMGEGMYALDLEGRVTTLNPAAREILGWTESEVVGREMHDIIHAEDDRGNPIPRHACPILRVLETGETVRVDEDAFTRRDGRVVPVSYTAAPIIRAREVVGVVVTFQDVTERKRAEERRRFLAEAGTILAQSLDYETTLAAIAKLMVPTLADWSAVHMLEEDGALRPLALVHRDPDKVQQALAAERFHANHPDHDRPLARVVRTGRSELLPEIPDSLLQQAARTAEHLEMLRGLGLVSAMVVPLKARGRVLGAVTLVSAESGRRYTDGDLAFAEEAANRAALAADNARLYSSERRAREALEWSEERYRALMTATSDLVWVTDAKGRPIEGARAWQALTGQSEEDAHGEGWLNAVHPEDREGFARAWAEALRTGQPHEGHMRVRVADGTLRDFIVRGVPVRDGSGRVREWIGSHTDVTERKRAEERLRARERQQAAVAALGQKALQGGSLQDLMEDAVSELRRVLGVEYAKVLELLPGGEHLRLSAGVGWRDGLVGQGTVDTGDDSQAGYTLKSEHPVIVKDLRTETRFRGPPLLVEHGVVSGMSVIIQGPNGPWGVLGTHTTEQREFTRDDVHFLQAVANVLAGAIQLADSREALEASEARTRAILDSALDAIVTTDADDRVVEFNPAAERIFGYAREDALGSNLADLVIPERYRDMHQRGMERYLATGESRILGERIEFPALRADGTEFDAELSVVRLPGEGPPHFTGFLRDVSHRNEMEAVLRESEERYRRLVADVKDYAILLLDPEGHVVTWNEGAREITGYSEQEITGRSFRTFFTPEDRARDLPERLLREARERGSVENEGWRVRKDGTRFWADAVLTALRDEHGTLLGFSKVTRDLTERRRAEEALRAERERLRAVLEALPVAVFIADAAGRIREVNEQAKAIWGADAPLAEGIPDYGQYKGWRAETGEPVASSEWALARALTRGEASRDEEIEIETFDGERKFILNSAVPIRCDDGPIQGAVAVSMDITGRKEREQDREESGRRYKSLFAENPDAVFEFDLEGRFLAANPACEEITGFPVSELLGDPWTRLVPETNLAHTMDAFLQAAGGKPVSVETAITHREGHRVEVSVLGFPWMKEEKIVGVWGIARDITEHKRYEREIEESRERHRSLFENSPDAVYVIDLAGRFTQVNPACERISGYAEETLLGHPWEPFVVPEDRARARESFDEAASGETTSFEIALIRRDGSRLDLRGTCFPHVVQGRVVGVCGIARDVTEQKKWEAELRRAKEELEERVHDRTSELAAANRELEAFSYSVSHDLRAPLRGIDAMSQALMEDYGERLDAEGRWFLKRMRGESARLTQLVNDLLALSRVTRGNLRWAEVDLSATARSVAQALDREAPGRAVEWSIEEGLSTRGDPSLLRAVLENLMGNAWKFTRGRAVARIAVGSAENDGEPAFFVRDNGAGFDPGQAHRLFEAFQRLHPSSEFEGTGVGLATVKRIVKRHGGRVWAEGRPGEGATFYFTIPERPASH